MYNKKELVNCLLPNFIFHWLIWVNKCFTLNLIQCYLNCKCTPLIVLKLLKYHWARVVHLPQRLTVLSLLAVMCACAKVQNCGKVKKNNAFVTMIYEFDIYFYKKRGRQLLETGTSYKKYGMSFLPEI